VNCEEYITSYLSAHTDGELTPEEERAVVEHLGSGANDGCAGCRARLAEEHLLKALIRRQATTIKTPEEFQARIHVALDSLDAEAGAQPARIRDAVVGELRRPRIWVPLAAAAAIVVALFIGSLPGVRRGGGPARSGVSSMVASAAFDQAVGAFDSFQSGFHPNVPSASLAAIATAYGAAEMPDQMWDLERAGYAVTGGRLDRLPDGNPVTYTLYHGPDGDILCTRYKASNFTIPPGAVAEHHGHRFYRYKGYSLCLTVSEQRHFICVLTAKKPMEQFERDIAMARAFSLRK
jgi:anti-sigma factor RsiW